jgi:UDP-N-acetylglucosamine:LPS N-acetylglucosamine transferase
VVCSAGFESIAEAACLGKPVLAIPVEGHHEQELNALDAFRCGLAVAADRYDLERVPAAPNQSALVRFRSWVRESDARLQASVQAALSHSATRASRPPVAEPG